MADAAALRNAKKRRETGLTLLEGPHILAEAVSAGAAITQVFGLSDDHHTEALAGAYHLPWVTVSPEALDRLAPTRSPRGPVAVMKIPAPHQPHRDVLVLYVTDPGNAGTLIRSAAAFGLDLVFAAGSVDPWAPKVIRAAAGAHFRTRVGVEPVGMGPAGTETVPGFGTIATVGHAGLDPNRLASRLTPDRHWAVLIGSEAHGLDQTMIDRAEVMVTVPMPGGTESLNAAVAGAIVAYELMRWRASE